MIDVLSFSWSLADKNVPHRKIPLRECHVFTSTCSFALLFHRLPPWAMDEMQVGKAAYDRCISRIDTAYLARVCMGVIARERLRC
jgi:hypothetical protein